MNISVRIQPNAFKNEILRMPDGTLKIKLTAPAIENRANEALINFLSEKLDLPKKAIVIIHGLHSRNKVIGISGIEKEMALRRLIGC